MFCVYFFYIWYNLYLSIDVTPQWLPGIWRSNSWSDLSGSVNRTQYVRIAGQYHQSQVSTVREFHYAKPLPKYQDNHPYHFQTLFWKLQPKYFDWGPRGVSHFSCLSLYRQIWSMLVLFAVLHIPKDTLHC